MERVLTQEERIRRAEEIYLRRRNLQQPQYRVQSREETNKISPGKSMRLFKRIGLQIIICLLLYCIFYLIYDTNFSFSNATITKTHEILNYDINIEEMYKSASMYINGLLHNTEQETQEIEENTEDNVEKSTTETEEPQEEQVESEAQVTEEQPVQETVTQEVVEQTQQTSAEEVNLKQRYFLIKPVKRRIYIF